MASRLDGKVALITGGASGLGLAACELFVEEGAKVVVADVQDGPGTEVQSRFGPECVRFIHCDVTDEEQIRRAIDEAVQGFGGLDATFHSAGAVGDLGTVESITIEGWDSVQALLVRSSMLIVKHSTAAMKKRGGGSIILTSSSSGITVGGAGRYAYSVAKAAVIFLGRVCCSQAGGRHDPRQHDRSRVNPDADLGRTVGRRSASGPEPDRPRSIRQDSALAASGNPPRCGGGCSLPGFGCFFVRHGCHAPGRWRSDAAPASRWRRRQCAYDAGELHTRVRTGKSRVARGAIWDGGQELQTSKPLLTRKSLYMNDSLVPEHIRFADVNGLRTRYYDTGPDANKQTLVLFHGGNIGFLASLDTWSWNFAGLRETFRVIAPDSVGQGFTEPPRNDADFTWDFCVKHMLALLTQIGVDDFHVGGHSRGGLMAAEVATRSQGVRSVVVLNSGSLAPDPTDPSFKTGAWFARLPTAGHRGAWSRDELRVEPQATSVTFEHITDDFLDRQQAIADLPYFREAESRMNDGLEKRVWEPSIDSARTLMHERLEREGLGRPVLVIWSANDKGSPLSTAGLPLFELLARHTDDAELHVLNRSGHYTCRERPEAFNRLVRDFCGRH